jgi:nucleotidyltransferase/DNA polymerase involved in DNA repair
VNQPTLRQYGQELPELSQNTAFTEICHPPVKVLADEVWSQEAQATIDTDIEPLQTLIDLVGNPEVSNQPIGQGISQFNEQYQPRTTTTSWPQTSQPPQRTTTNSWPQPSQPPQRYIQCDVESLPRMVDTGEEIIRALRQVVSTPKIKYMHFDGDPVNYISFMHNFDTCLEKDNPDL